MSAIISFRTSVSLVMYSRVQDLHEDTRQEKLKAVGFLILTVTNPNNNSAGEKEHKFIVSSLWTVKLRTEKIKS